MTEPADWVRLTSVSDQFEADLLTGHLRSVGIDSRSSKSAGAPGAWLTGSQNPFGPIEIFVPSEQLDAAQDSLGSVEPTTDDDTARLPEVSPYRNGDTASFYDAYSELEWERLEATAYGRLQAIIHTDFIRQHVPRDSRVLDAGSGPGRFSVELARLGANVTVLDTSAVQLDLARRRIGEAGLLDNVEQFLQADITDLSDFADDKFDAIVCYGGALSYVRERRFEAAKELMRVTKPGGTVLVSVMSRYGASANLSRRPVIDFLKDPWEDLLWQVIETGDLSGVPSTKVVGQAHPPMHLYSSDELVDLFRECEIVAVAGSNVTATEAASALDEVASEPAAWATAVEMESRLCTKPGLLDSGSHLILVAQVT